MEKLNHGHYQSVKATGREKGQFQISVRFYSAIPFSFICTTVRASLLVHPRERNLRILPFKKQFLVLFFLKLSGEWPEQCVTVSIE
jgi:uncharacterized Tic20 family protein